MEAPNLLSKGLISSLASVAILSSIPFGLCQSTSSSSPSLKSVLLRFLFRLLYNFADSHALGNVIPIHGFNYLYPVSHVNMAVSLYFPFIHSLLTNSLHLRDTIFSKDKQRQSTLFISSYFTSKMAMEVVSISVYPYIYLRVYFGKNLYKS